MVVQREQKVRKAGLAAFVVAMVGLIALAPAFACTQQARLVAPSGPLQPGATFRLLGQDFEPTSAATGGSVTVRWGGVAGDVVATVDANEAGQFEVDVAVPAAAAPGWHTISATQWRAPKEKDGVMVEQAAFTPGINVRVAGETTPAPATAQPVTQPTGGAPAPAATPGPAAVEPPPTAATSGPQAAASPSQPVAGRRPAAPPAAAAAPAPAAVAAPAAVPVEAVPVTPAAPAAPVAPVVSPDAVTADLWSGFGTVRGPLDRRSDPASAPAGQGGQGAFAVWFVVAGVAAVGAGAFGLVRRRAVVAEPPTTD